jgi:hypothetical protein
MFMHHVLMTYGTLCMEYPLYMFHVKSELYWK